MTVQDARLLMSNHVALSTSQFVGRQHELAIIWSQYQVVKTGSARVVLVRGEPGIGKTRLLDEFSALAADDEATILRGNASDFRSEERRVGKECRCGCAE